MNFKRLFMVSALALAGCQTTIGQDVATNVQISIYNDLSSTYSYRPTFAIADTYFIQIYSKNWKDEKIFTNVTTDTAEDTLAVLDKYQKWNEKALKNKHILNKEIATVGHFTYSFFSGDENNHYLVSKPCSICEGVYLDQKNVTKWKQQIIDWQAGKINTNDISSEYN